MSAFDWKPGTPELKNAAAAVLVETLKSWQRLTETVRTDGEERPSGPSQWWPALIRLTSAASSTIGGYSEIAHRTRQSADRLVQRAEAAGRAIDELAVALLCDLGGNLHDDCLLAEASSCISEVADESDGVFHTADAIADLLQVTILCLEEHAAVPSGEREDGVVAILAPLLAQRCCLIATQQLLKPTRRSTIPNSDLAAIQTFCVTRVPEHALDQVRVEHTIRGNVVTIIERRAPWRPEAGPDWTTSSVAQLRYTPARMQWTLHSRDRNERWHLYFDTDPVTNLPTLLAEIDADPTGIFWG